MLDCSIVWESPQFAGSDERPYILLDEIAGKFGSTVMMSDLEAYQINEEARATGSPWRWFRFEDKEKAN